MRTGVTRRWSAALPDSSRVMGRAGLHASVQTPVSEFPSRL